MSKKCTNCGHLGLNSMNPTLYHYKSSGLDNVYLKGGVIEYVCPKCGERYYDLDAVRQIEKAWTKKSSRRRTAE